VYFWLGGHSYWQDPIAMLLVNCVFCKCYGYLLGLAMAQCWFKNPFCEWIQVLDSIVAMLGCIWEHCHCYALASSVPVDCVEE